MSESANKSDYAVSVLIPEGARGKVLHVTIDDSTMMDKEQLNELAQLFLTALVNEQGAVVVTREGINARIIEVFND